MTAATDRRWTELRDQLEAAATTLDRLADLVGADEDGAHWEAATVGVATALLAVAVELNRTAS